MKAAIAPMPMMLGRLPVRPLDGDEAPDDRKEITDQAAQGVHATSRHIGAALGDGGGGSDRSDRSAFVQRLPVCRRFADHQAAC